MRLSPNKIEYLSETVLEMIEKDPQIHIQTNSDLVYRVIVDHLYADIKAEDDIDDEVEELLEQYRGKVNAMDIDVGALRTKMKREIAKKHGFML